MTKRCLFWRGSLAALVTVLPFWVEAEPTGHLSLEQVNKAMHELEALAQTQIRNNAVPGMAIAVVFQDKRIYAKGFGVRDVVSNGAVDPDTVFQVASVSKPLGATVIAELVGAGKINWD